MEDLKMQEIITIVPRIPDELIYEIIDGKPVYYKGYKDVISQEIQIEQIMGSSFLQSEIIRLIVRLLLLKTELVEYPIYFNELGVHLSHKINISADIAIYHKEQLKLKIRKDTYTDVPPKIIIEIDTKADLSNFDNVMDYYTVKTNKLFEFGVEKVLWILTKNKQIIEALPNQPWLIKSWKHEVVLIENVGFTLEQLLKDEGIWDLIE